MEIHVIQEHPYFSVSTESVVALVNDFLAYSRVKYDEASIYFVDIKTICELHDQYFGDPSPTDCVSFPMDSSEETGYRMMGDVFVCPEVASNYSSKHGGDRYQELTLYVIHGLLHLLGYDDIEDKDRQEMRTAEATYLTRVAKKNLWLQQ